MTVAVAAKAVFDFTWNPYTNLRAELISWKFVRRQLRKSGILLKNFGRAGVRKFARNNDSIRRAMTDWRPRGRIYHPLWNESGHRKGVFQQHPGFVRQVGEPSVSWVSVVAELYCTP